MPPFLTLVRGGADVLEVDARTVLGRGARPAPVEVEPAQSLEPFESALSAHGDRSYAQLVATRVDDTHFVLQGQHRDPRHQLLPGTPRAGPSLALGDLAAKGGLSPEDLDESIDNWSRLGVPELRAWLAALRADIGDDDLRLVIWDTTGFEIPWEALTLEADEAGTLPAGPLGALLAVTRRVGAPPESAGEDVGHVCAGGVLAYLDAQFASDAEVLARWQPGLVEPATLLAQLREGEEPVGLVYVGCHGTWAAEVTGLRLGAVRHRDVSRWALPRLASSRSLVFLNACHAGRLLDDPLLRAGLLGFAEAFLRRGAAVVIAPTGAVEVELARQVARRVLEDLASHPDRPVSVALRDARAAAARAALSGPGASEAELKAYFYTSMFVCYGNPYARLALPVGDVP